MGQTNHDSVHQGGSPSITVLALSSCQAANGSFPRSPTLTSLFGAALDTNPSVEWSTALAVAWFEERCQGQRDEWELVVDKARRWLVGLGQGGMVDQARWEGTSQALVAHVTFAGVFCRVKSVPWGMLCRSWW